MKNIKIKQEFAIKTPAELDKLSHEELLKYIKDLQKRLVKEKPKKNSSNSSIAPSTDMTKPSVVVIFQILQMQTSQKQKPIAYL